LAVTVVLHTIIDPVSTHFERIAVASIGAALILLIMLRVLDFTRVNRHPLSYLVVYQIFAAIGITFLSRPATPYVLVLFLLVFISNLYYGAKGVWATVGVFAFTTIAKFAYLSIKEGISSTDQINIIVTLAVFLAVSAFFINIQKIYDWDRARLHDTVKEAIVEQKRLRALVNNMTESVLVLDKEGVIRLYNAAALGLFDTNNSLSDKPLDGFVRFEDEKGILITTLDLMPKDTKPIVRSDIVLRYKGDDTAALSIVVTPIRSTFGQEEDEGGYVMTLRDITHEKSLEEERDEFISVISHELRTPVTVAEAGVSNALLLATKLEGEKAEKIQKSLQTAHDQSIYLANMLNDLTTFARAEKGTLDLELEEFDPRDLLERLKEDYHNAVEAKGMFLAVSPDPSTPLRMASNRLYIREILQNFITNSIKYSDKGTITLSVRAKDKGVLYSVSDEGIGISTSDLKKIFEKFFRAEDYRTRATNGTGLGLYVTKKLAKILDATFEVQSEVGKGSTFSVYIPDMMAVLSAKKQAAMAPIPPRAQQATHAPSATVPVSSTSVATPHTAPVSGSTLSPLSPSIMGLAPSTPQLSAVPEIPAQHSIASPKT